jgi:alkylation response protein AidB-like acyl-CoA dehydrogenase
LRTLVGEAGLLTPAWPVEYGGLELTPSAASAVEATLRDFGLQPSEADFIGLALAGATILRWGTDAQKRCFLPLLARGEHQWCQLFSEPGAGSDLAGLSTRAVRSPDGAWLVNGQKVWSSFAHVADYGLLMARSDPDPPKHRGITYFVIGMRSVGVECRPLRQMTGEAEFNEVFFTDVACRTATESGRSTTAGRWRSPR